MKKHSDYSRRSLLKLLGTTAATAPFISTRSMAQPASKTVRHASFGAGGMAWTDLQQIANCPNVEIVAVCDVDPNQMKEAKTRFPNARFYRKNFCEWISCI